MLCEKWLLGGVLQKSFPKNFLKIHREIPVRRSLSNNVKSFHGVRACNFIKESPPHWCFRSSRLWIYYKIGVLEKFRKFKGKHLSSSLFLNNV